MQGHDFDDVNGCKRSGAPEKQVPDVDAELLLALLEYAAWATRKTLDHVDQLPPDALTRAVVNSFPTLLATLQHVYGWDEYYCIHLKGGHAERQAITEPATYDELKQRWSILHDDIVTWGRENLTASRNAPLQGWGVWPAWMVVMQMSSHATHHLGQVVTLLRQLGYAPPKIDSTDLIRYLLRRFPQENQTAWVTGLLARDTTPVAGTKRGEDS